MKQNILHDSHHWFYSADKPENQCNNCDGKNIDRLNSMKNCFRSDTKQQTTAMDYHSDFIQKPVNIKGERCLRIRKRRKSSQIMISRTMTFTTAFFVLTAIILNEVDCREFNVESTATTPMKPSRNSFIEQNINNNNITTNLNSTNSNSNVNAVTVNNNFIPSPRFSPPPSLSSSSSPSPSMLTTLSSSSTIHENGRKSMTGNNTVNYYHYYDNVNNSQNNKNSNNVYDNETISENNPKNPSSSSKPAWIVGNELWDGIIRDCYEKPTFSCFQKNVYTYLDKTLDISDVNITNRLMFYKNKVDFTKYTRKVNERDQKQYAKKDKNSEVKSQDFKRNADNNSVDEGDDYENEIPDESRSDHLPKSPIEEVTSALYGKSMKFMMTHDVELKLPDMVFDGATLRISPKSIEGSGAIVKLEVLPSTAIESRGDGRIFKKKIKEAIKSKLILSLLAIILIIKLIKIKIFWVLPIIIGVHAAKKLILKFLLFLFPALAHIFKLCSYYHANYHQTKYHHHHHHVNHHHTAVPPPWHEHDHHAPEIIYTSPPKVHPSELFHSGPPPIYHEELGWESSGPGLGSEFIGDIHRNAHVDAMGFKPKYDDINDIQAWGLGTTHPSGMTGHSYNVNPFMSEPTSPKLRAHPVYVPPQKSTPLASQIIAKYDPGINLQPKQQVRDVHRTQAQIKEALRIQAEQRLVAQQQKILQQQPFVQDGQPLTPKGYDPFYSPILTKIDKILLQLGFTDDYCKERLVCSMYKNPSRFSPHSNFVSAELSRDTSELEKPESPNAAVIRFYRFVQAARDGQDQKDCLQAYPQCSINTE